jgi:hypothetical protein
MDEDQHDSRLPRNQDPPATRRKFLRQIGMTTATAAVVAGLADVAGMKPAFAATKGTSTSKGVPARSDSPEIRKMIQEIRTRNGQQVGGLNTESRHITLWCQLTPGHCGGPCEPSSVWCHRCCQDYSCTPQFSGHCQYVCLYGSVSRCLSLSHM